MWGRGAYLLVMSPLHGIVAAAPRLARRKPVFRPAGAALNPLRKIGAEADADAAR